MVYRSPGINWNLLVGPASQGISDSMRIMESKRNRRDAQIASLGRALDIRKDRAESRYRFDQQLGLQQERLGMERQRFEMDKRKFEEDLLDKQAFRTYILDKSSNLTNQINAKAAAGLPYEEEAQELKKVLSASESPDAVAIGLMEREGKKMSLGAENCPDGT